MSILPFDYNTPHPPTLFAAGILRGDPINVDPCSIRPSNASGLFLANLTCPLRTPDGKDVQRDGEENLVAVKVVEDDRTRVPRDGKREARLLAKLDHPNILALLNAYLTPPSPSSLSSTIKLFTPFYPLPLSSVLSSQAFTSSISGSATFSTLAHSLAFQLLSAVAHLHAQDIAHRDINPNNVVLARSGRLILLDFGIAVRKGGEKASEMHFEVGTGAHRAPELVFASRTYDAPAIDLWALATTLCEFFTPLETPPPLSPASSVDIDDAWRHYRDDDESETEETLRRKTLFDGGASDFLLAGSIFRVLGTPTVETWPEAAHLPNFSRFTFSSFPPTPLILHLPHLDPSSPLEHILPSMLNISASKRMSAKEAVEILQKEAEVILPESMGGGRAEDGRSLEELLASMTPL
ncbi:hypothetical protein JCM11251_007048 [Rhodosporidiobolus azoricus]